MDPKRRRRKVLPFAEQLFNLLPAFQPLIFSKRKLFSHKIYKIKVPNLIRDHKIIKTFVLSLNRIISAFFHQKHSAFCDPFFCG